MPPRKKSRSRRRPAKTQGGSHRLRVVLAALFVLGFLVVSLVFLSHLRESLQKATPAPPVAGPANRRPTEVEPDLPSRRAPGAEPAAVLEDIRVEVESALLRSGVTLHDIQRGDPAEEPLRLDIRGEFPPSGILSDLDRRLSRIDSEIHLESRPTEGLLQILWRGTPRFRLHFFLPAARPPHGDRPRLAIVMDDLGRDLRVGRALLAIDLPVTLAILPGEAHAAGLAELAHRNGREILIHLPMEPQGYPVVNPGNDALFVDLPADEIRRRMETYLQQVPYAVGGNNHMGSRFTEDRTGMEAVLGVMKENNFFFLDSLTTGQSVAYAEARRAGVPAAVRDVFLDNVPEVEKIAREIRRLVGVAKRRGHAIGICHPYPETLEALRRETAELHQAGVELVPVGQLVVR